MRFTVRRDYQRPSPCSRRPSGGQDVARSVDVSMLEGSAGSAPESRLALSRRPVDMAAACASDGSAVGTNLDDLDPSRVSLVFQPPQDHSPPLSEDRAIEPSLGCDVPPGGGARPLCGLCHGVDAEPFNGDEIVGSHQVGSDLFDPVLHSVGFPISESGGSESGSFGSTALRLLSGKLALKPDHSSGLGCAQTRDMEQLTVASCKSVGDPAVDPCLNSGRQAFSPARSLCEGNVPPAGMIEGHPVGGGLADRARPSEAHAAGFGQQDGSESTVQATDMVWLDVDNTKPLPAIPAAPTGMSVCSPPVVHHRLPKVSQGLLLDHNRASSQPGFRSTQLSQLPCLLAVTGPSLTAFTTSWSIPLGELLLLQGEIPYEPGMGAVLSEDRLLLRSRIQPESHACIIPVGCDSYRRPPVNLSLYRCDAGANEEGRE